MRMLYLLTALVAAGCGEKNNPEPLGKNTSPLSEKVQQANQDPKAPRKVKTATRHQPSHQHTGRAPATQ